MDGYITTHIFKEPINFIFVFMRITFMNFDFFRKSTSGFQVRDRTKMKEDRTYLKFFLNASGEYPVCFLKNLIK
jgi:hypothetical protein